MYDRGPNDFIRLPDVEAVLAELKKLGADQQFIAVARAMEPYLAGRPAAVRNTVKTIVGGSLLKANGPRETSNNADVGYGLAAAAQS